MKTDSWASKSYRIKGMNETLFLHMPPNEWMNHSCYVRWKFFFKFVLMMGRLFSFHLHSLEVVLEQKFTHNLHLVHIDTVWSDSKSIVTLDYKVKTWEASRCLLNVYFTFHVTVKTIIKMLVHVCGIKSTGFSPTCCAKAINKTAFFPLLFRPDVCIVFA